MPETVCLPRIRHIMPVVMLALFVLPSFGVSTMLSRVALNCEVQEANSTQSEVLEERVPCSTERREQSQRLNRRVGWPIACLAIAPPLASRCGLRRAIIGHRLFNGILAPIRC